MSAPMMSFGGIASGLPADLVEQLIDAERQPVRRLEQRQQELEIVDGAWSSVQTRLSSVRQAVDAVRRPEGLSEQFAAASTDDSAVAVTVTGQPAEGSVTFSVEQLAQRMQQTSDDAFAGLDSELGEREIVVNGQSLDLDDGATLADLVDAVNDAGLGVEASALQVRPGEYQLVLTAERAGAEHGFTVDGPGWDSGFAVTQGAQDARLDVGGITVTRDANEVEDLIEGLSLDLRQAGTGPVTVSAERDVDEAVDRVTALVAEINKALDHIDELSRYDLETQRAGPLQGDSTLRRIANDLRGAMSGAVDGLEGEYGLASGVGVNLTRDGRLEVDDARLREAFEQDFESAARLFARSGESSSPEVAEVLSTSRATEGGEYDVEIARAAKVASLAGAIDLPPQGDPQRYRISSGGQSATVAISEGANATQAAQEIRDALATAEIDTLEVEAVGDDDLRLSEERYGSAHSIAVELETAPGVWEETASAVGEDAEVIVDGETHVGAGRRVAIDDGAADGLRFVAAGAEGESAALTLTQGVGGAVDRVLAHAEGAGGSVRRAQTSLDGQAERLQSRIEAFERRLEVREAALRRQFTAMESSLARLMDQGQWLEGQLAGLPGQQ